MSAGPRLAPVDRIAAHACAPGSYRIPDPPRVGARALMIVLAAVTLTLLRYRRRSAQRRQR